MSEFERLKQEFEPVACLEPTSARPESQTLRDDPCTRCKVRLGDHRGLLAVTYADKVPL